MADNGSSSQQCCPPFVCLVPVAVLPQAGMAGQPMQMYMSQQMATPAPNMVMMPQPETMTSAPSHNSFSTYFADSSSAWAGDASWAKYTGEPFWESAPQQLPMEATARQVLALSAAVLPNDCQLDPAEQAEVPGQIVMDTITPQPQMQQNTVARGRILRRRRGQQCPTQDPHALSGAAMNTEEQEDLDVDTQAEATDAQAQEIAQRAIDQFRAGGNQQRAAVADFERLAFTSFVTTKAAQKLLDEVSRVEGAAFATGLRGHVRSAIHSKHANHVIQKIIEVMPAASASFIMDELKGYGLELARHPFGCRVFCRILEHLTEAHLDLIEEVFADVKSLIDHPMGSFVVRHLLEFGRETHRHRVVEAMSSDLAAHAKDKFGSHVIEKALEFVSTEDQYFLARQLLEDKDQLMVLSGNQFGRHVVRALLTTSKMPAELKQEAVAALRPKEDQLRSLRYGKSVVQALRAVA